MDFTLSETQQEIASLATQILGGVSTDDRVRDLDGTDTRFDERLWDELGRANLLGLGLPEADGGSGLGVIETCLVLEQVGRFLGHVPLPWSTAAAMTIAEHGPPSQRDRLGQGSTILTVAAAEEGAAALDAPATRAEGDRLTGRKLSVPWAHVASALLVTTSDGVVLVDAAAPGVRSDRAEATNHEIVTHVEFDGAPCVVVGGEEARRFLLERLLVGLCAVQLGVAGEALARAAAYTSTRIQFGKPLSSFQSTSARAADAYIDIQAMRATMLQAAWRLDTGLDASLEVEVAKWWASEGGQRVVHAAQHMHGGIGADVSYPIHRYFLWGKQIEDTLGGGSAHLARIGALLA